MRVIDANFVHSKPADIVLMVAALQGKAGEDFATLRDNIPAFANLEDGELTQIAQDAGFQIA